MIPDKHVWVFNGEGGPFPGGVFSSRKLAEQWIRARRLAGVFKVYPLDEGLHRLGTAREAGARALERSANPAFDGSFTSATQEHFTTRIESLPVADLEKPLVDAHDHLGRDEIKHLGHVSSESVNDRLLSLLTRSRVGHRAPVRAFGWGAVYRTDTKKFALRLGRGVVADERGTLRARNRRTPPETPETRPSKSTEMGMCGTKTGGSSIPARVAAGDRGEPHRRSADLAARSAIPHRNCAQVLATCARNLRSRSGLGRVCPPWPTASSSSPPCGSPRGYSNFWTRLGDAS